MLTGGAGVDRFVIQASSGNDHITDFCNRDTIVFDASSGVDRFSDLTLTKGRQQQGDYRGTSDSLTVDGVKPDQLHASDFQFVGAAASLRRPFLFPGVI